jgi:serine/threonine-protein kinase
VRGTLELCLQKDPKDRVRDIGDVRLALDGRLAAVAGAPAARARPKRHALAAAAGLVLGVLATSAYLASRTTPAPLAADRAALPVTRFAINLPASAPLTDLGGYDVVISPDGQRLAYFAHNLATGNVALYVRELDGLEARLLPGTEVSSAGTSGNMNPFFSADGQSIGFLAPDRGVVRVSLDGGPAQKIVDSPSPGFLGATWIDDDTVVYSSGASLHRVSGRGGTPQRLTDDFANGVIAGPKSLPGGQAVLIDRIEEGIVHVAALDLSTGEQKIVVEGGQGPTYAATGHVVFARGTALLAVSFDAKALAVTGEPVTVLEGVRHSSSANAPDYALSASGTLVYVPSASETDTRAAVVWVDRTGQAVGRAVNELLENPRDPALSPDGTRLALTTGPASDGDVWSYDLRGRPPIRLAAAGDAHHAVWSPDSRRIAFTVLNVPSADVHEVAADGTMLTPRLVRSLWLSRVHAWSAAGELFLVRLPGGNIEVMSVTGETESRELVATEYAEFDPALSPNGRWLAYASNRTGRNEVWVQGYPEGAVVRISTDGGYEPQWSADGRELYYLEPSGPRASMMAVTVQTAGEFSFDTPAKLFETPYFADEATMVGSYDVAHDGRFVMVDLVEAAAPGARSASIIVVQNWTEELKRRVPAE